MDGVVVASDGQKIDLTYADEWMEDETLKCYEARDGSGFGGCGYSGHTSLELVFKNKKALKTRGIYEAALVSAYVGCKHNNLGYPSGLLLGAFIHADTEKMLAAGSPLPSGNSFVAYRGVSGIGRSRRVGGMSWTLDLDTACWFAVRHSQADPAVMRATVRRGDVFCYVTERGEHELICLAPRASRMPLSVDEMTAGRDRVNAIRNEEQKREWAKAKEGQTV